MALAQKLACGCLMWELRQQIEKSGVVLTMANELNKVPFEIYEREFCMLFTAGIASDADTAQFIEEITSSLGYPEEISLLDFKDSLPPRYSSPEAEKQAIIATRDEARKFLHLLRYLAVTGNTIALSELVQNLAHNLDWLEGFSFRENGKLKKIASCVGTWPVKLNSRPRTQKQAKAYLIRIDLSTKCEPALDWQQLVEQNEFKNPAPLPFKSPEQQSLAIVNWSHLAGIQFAKLRPHVAEGNLKATINFVQLLAENVGWLEKYSIRNMANLQKVATITSDWPVMLTRSSDRAKEAVDYLKRIKLGTKAQISLSPKWGTTWRRGGGTDGAVATRCAKEIRDAVGNARYFFQSHNKVLEAKGPLSRAAWEKMPEWIKAAGKLPTLTKASAPKWFEIGWGLLMKKHNGHPEKAEKLRGLGNFKKFHTELTGKQKKGASRTAESNIRDGIKQRIREALRSLAPPS